MTQKSWRDLYNTATPPPPGPAGGGYRELTVGKSGATDIDRSMAGELIAVHPGDPADTPLKFSAEKGGSTPETANDSVYVIIFIPDLVGQSAPDTKIPLQGIAGDQNDTIDTLTPGAMLYIVNQPGVGWVIHYRMVNAPIKDDPGDDQASIDGATFMARSGTQTAFDLDSVDPEKINAITTRTQKRLPNYVGPLGTTGLDYYAPPGAVMGIRNEEMVFTPDKLGGQPVYFVPDPDYKDPLTGKPVKIHGVAIQCSGYFRLIVPENALLDKEPFSAVELDEGINSGAVGDGRVFPPGGYIWHLDGTAPVGIEMKDSYSVGDGVKLSQPSGYKALYIELYSTAEPDLYIALSHGETYSLLNIDDPLEPPIITDNPVGYDPQEILTVDRLRTILTNIFSAASKDPTGEGYAYLPWKYERWYRKDQGAPDWDLSTVDVAKLNAATRTTKGNSNIYAGVFATAPRNGLLSPVLDLYAAADVVLVKRQTDDGKPTVMFSIESQNPKTKTITVLSGQRDFYGVMDVYVSADTTFSFKFTATGDPANTVALKVVRAFDPVQKNTILLVDGKNYSIEDSIFPRGDYIFRPYTLAGFTLSVLGATSLPDAQPINGAGVEITLLRQSAGRDYYNAWFETAGIPKVVNSVDPKDQPTTLEGLIQSEPAELEDVEELESTFADEIKRLEALIAGSGIWKIETWLGLSDPARPFPIMPPTGANQVDLGNGVSAVVSTVGAKTIEVVDHGLIYRDPDNSVSNKSFSLRQTTAPYLDQVEISTTQRFRLTFSKPGDPATIIPYDGKTIIVASVDYANNGAETVLSVDALTKPLAATAYEIQMSVPVDINVNYRPIGPPTKGGFVLNVRRPAIVGKPVPFSVVWGTDGKIKSIINVNDVTDRRTTLDGMKPAPTLVEEEIKNEVTIDKDGKLISTVDGQPITVDQLTGDLRSQMDAWERSAGYQDVGTATTNPIEIDWSQGRYRRLVTLSAPAQINIIKPPPTPQMVEIIVMRGADEKNRITGIQLSDKDGKPITDKNGKPILITVKDADQPQGDAPCNVRLFWDGKSYYKDVDSF